MIFVHLERNICDLERVEIYFKGRDWNKTQKSIRKRGYNTTRLWDQENCTNLYLAKYNN
jgi:hypothetical protein